MDTKLEQFEGWLNENTDLSRRSRSDVVSRVRRVNTYIDPLGARDEEELELRIKRAPVFLECSASVRSQLKRAAILYRQFAVNKRWIVREPSRSSPTFIDLFSGAGGFSLGLIEAGWRPLLALDNWDDAVSTYRANLSGHPVISQDIREVRGPELVKLTGDSPDWIVGGPPCQGFSTVGKRIRKDPRNFLIHEFIRIVEEIRPAGAILENVLGLRDMNFVTFIVDQFALIGYRVTPVVLKSADYGVPQLRRRIFFIADKQDRLFVPPRPTHAADQYVSVWDAIGDLPELQCGQEKYSYDKPPATDYQERMRTGSDSLQGHKASRHPSHLVKAISFIPDGGNRKHIPPEYQPSSGFHNSYSRLHSASPAVAVTQNMGKPSGTRCIHPFQNRGLSAREGARLQSFPDAFHFRGGVTSQRLQIANAVPPILARRIGWAVSSDEHWSESAAALSANEFFSSQLALPLEDLSFADVSR